ncbi:TlpA family protein disulfide reductase [Prauserella cavernicola]|uniref:TlpA family protein disulfide reductase n=1 Tax=Prauserella cavernicola TaxID=2800127 RepID=A0A934QTG3_9PSEU|nr:TlpA disulfide reductase family protein [Prauserella cavernicola]MBK1785078.1 TlpA family protein disulfide reductase [Prauserella cavernicola]
MTTATKWALAVGVLALAVLVAVLPNLRGEQPAQPGAAAGEDLGPARAAAALEPCPRGEGTVEQLAGVEVPCLGDGSQVDLGSALAGETTLVNVWATWCGPCREELPLLQEYAERPGAARVLAVQVQSGAREGLELFDELGVRLPSVYDGEGPTGPVRDALRVPRSLPASYLVSPDGSVRLIENPRLFRSVEQIREAVGAAR